MLWLWHRLTAAALIRYLAWELPYATGAALKRKKEKNNSVRLTSDDRDVDQQALSDTAGDRMSYLGKQFGNI